MFKLHVHDCDSKYMNYWWLQDSLVILYKVILEENVPVHACDFVSRENWFTRWRHLTAIIQIYQIYFVYTNKTPSSSYEQDWPQLQNNEDAKLVSLRKYDYIFYPCRPGPFPNPHTWCQAGYIALLGISKHLSHPVGQQEQVIRFSWPHLREVESCRSQLCPYDTCRLCVCARWN